jgi:hypothetical protein
LEFFDSIMFRTGFFLKFARLFLICHYLGKEDVPERPELSKNTLPSILLNRLLQYHPAEFSVPPVQPTFS